MTNTNGMIRTDKCAKICSNKTPEGYCKSTACINTYRWTGDTNTASNIIVNTYTDNYPRPFGECSCCEHREVCKFKDDFEEARNKLLEKHKNIPILKIECMYYQSRGLNITSTNSDNGETTVTYNVKNGGML